jgi:predicted metal-binding membrane protein
LPTKSASVDSVFSSSSSAKRGGAQAALLAAGIALFLLAAWFITAAMAADFYAALEAQSPAWTAKGAGGFLLIFAMWAVMMAAMMLPGALPAIAVFFKLSAAAQPQGGKTQAPFVLAAAFAASYLFAWLLFSLAAAIAQQTAAAWGALSAKWTIDAPFAAAALAGVAGLFQLSRAKQKCLALCGNPLAFFLLRRRRGLGGALYSGLCYGGFCVGCCWALMLLLFAGGVMDLRLIAALAGFALLEKTLPARAAKWLTLCAAGGLLFFAALALARELL